MNTIQKFETTGPLTKVHGVMMANLQAAIGEVVLIRTATGKMVRAEVIGFEDQQIQIMPLTGQFQLQPDDLVIATGGFPTIPIGDNLLGRVIDSSGKPLDDRGPIRCPQSVTLEAKTPPPLHRQSIDKPFETGIRAIDSLLTIGRGQRVGIFSGSGVGKSTLLGNIARSAESEVNIVVLVGERGREVRPFIERSLGPAGLAKSVVVVSTSDETPLSRIRAVESAIAIAGSFRDRGRNVLFMLDSITRLAFAQRELGLLLGEPPTSRGYPPSVFQKLAEVLEQLGNSDCGSITALVTVLVDGDDMNDPVADSARSILDGHIVLDRAIAAQNHFPAIDVMASNSRLANQLISESQSRSAGAVKKSIALYRHVEDMVLLGAHQRGKIPETDRAIDAMPAINRFLAQGSEPVPFEAMSQQLEELAQALGVGQEAPV